MTTPLLSLTSCSQSALQSKPRRSRRTAARTTGTLAVAVTAADSERLDELAPALSHPPPLDLCIRVITELHLALRAIRPLVRVPIRDRLAVELRGHRGAHGLVPCTLFRSVVQVEYLLV
jgi:hypothetical protein